MSQIPSVGGPSAPAVPVPGPSNLGLPGSALVDIPVDISRMLYMLYLDVEQQITRADFKAQITLGTATLLAALSVNLGFGFRSVEGFRLVEWVAAFFYLCCAGGLFATIGFAVAAAFPRSVGKNKTPDAARNLYFTADIIQIPPDEYVRRFLSQTNETLKESVVRQIQIKGGVLERKLLFVRHGLRAMMGAIICGVIGYGVLLAARGI